MKYVIPFTIYLYLATFVVACWGNSGEFDGWGVRDQTSPALDGVPSGTRCATTYATQPCLCYFNAAGIPGRQVCLDNGGWGECECQGISDGGDPSRYDSFRNKIPLDFFWQRTVPVGGSCKAGRYDGGFDGIYIPAITFGFGPIPVFGNVTFQLEKSSTGEFYSVKNGHMIGSALVAFPFEGEIIGTLDCESRAFVGELKNCYYVIPGLPPFAFEGIIEAQYDRFNNTFVNGVWSVTEIDATGNFPDPLPVSSGAPVPFPPPLGGTGTWINQWIQ